MRLGFRISRLIFRPNIGFWSSASRRNVREGESGKKGEEIYIGPYRTSHDTEIEFTLSLIAAVGPSLRLFQMLNAEE